MKTEYEKVLLPKSVQQELENYAHKPLQMRQRLHGCRVGLMS